MLCGGISGKVHIIGRKFASSHRFGVVNVIGKSYKELGIWTEGLGFSKSITDKAIYNSSMQNLGQVFWPRESFYPPKGWAVPNNTDSLKIGTYDSLVEQIYLKKFDALVGDVSVIADRSLKTGEIEAGFLNGSYLKLFLAKYCRSFIVAGPTYKVGGFGFAFPKGSPMITDVNKALLEVFESGKLRELEDKMIASGRCVEVESSYDDEIILSLNSFWILFALTGGTTTCALTIYALDGLRRRATNFTPKLFKMATTVSKHWGHQIRRFSRKVSDEDIPEDV
ncbi:hypothetical protein POM88_006848 [Heracleum sosnowskyi]|uniref:Ionotropic glutamate receptor C-terminal domain-containing protein n=1 Tax=Heracleum sosnowskyi TaxID=360622 RepID=A0AAD8J741_9APIA|nr:hypothetical protein POM88_006848 [Heracleum sosnowskyi]